MSKHVLTKFDDRVEILQQAFLKGHEFPKGTTVQHFIDIIIAASIDGTAKDDNQAMMILAATTLAVLFTKENPENLSGAKFRYALQYEYAPIPIFSLGDKVIVNNWTAMDVLRIVDWDYDGETWIYKVVAIEGLEAHIKEEDLTLFAKDRE